MQDPKEAGTTSKKPIEKRNIVSLRSFALRNTEMSNIINDLRNELVSSLYVEPKTNNGPKIYRATSPQIFRVLTPINSVLEFYCYYAVFRISRKLAWMRHKEAKKANARS